MWYCSGRFFNARTSLWLAPVQIIAMGITDKQADYVQSVVKTLRKSGLRAESDLRNEKIGFKIREHTLSRIPYILVAGDREIEANSIAVRTRSGEDLGTMTIESLTKILFKEIESKEIVTNLK